MSSKSAATLVYCTSMPLLFQSVFHGLSSSVTPSGQEVVSVWATIVVSVIGVSYPPKGSTVSSCTEVSRVWASAAGVCSVCVGFACAAGSSVAGFAAQP